MEIINNNIIISILSPIFSLMQKYKYKRIYSTQPNTFIAIDSRALCSNISIKKINLDYWHMLNRVFNNYGLSFNKKKYVCIGGIFNFILILTNNKFSYVDIVMKEECKGKPFFNHKINSFINNKEKIICSIRSRDEICFDQLNLHNQGVVFFVSNNTPSTHKNIFIVDYSELCNENELLININTLKPSLIIIDDINCTTISFMVRILFIINIAFLGFLSSYINNRERLIDHILLLYRIRNPSLNDNIIKLVINLIDRIIFL